MRSVMWIQSDSPGGEDYLIVDGTLLSKDAGPIREQAFDIIYKSQDIKYGNLAEMDVIRKETGSANLQLGYGPLMGYMYKSVFNENASDGRNNTFVFWFNKKGREHFWEDACKSASCLGLSLRDREREMVDKYFRLKEKKSKFLLSFVSGVISTLIICYIISYVRK